MVSGDINEVEDRMVQRVQIILDDDLDGSVADETVAFGLDGTDYEIDLSSDNASKLRDGLAPFIVAGRKGGRRGLRNRTARRGGGASPTDVRSWAEANGYRVASRGRVPAEIQELYAKAH